MKKTFGHAEAKCPGESRAPNESPGFDRVALSRALSRVGNATVREALAGLVSGRMPEGCRIGITGPPGAGKSSLIARLAKQRLERATRLGILAIDPTSPISEGSILGDRVRMGGELADHRVFYRSMPSRRAHDGLTDNIADLLWTMESHGLEELIIETVGVGQVNYTIRSVADTVVLVLVPGAGDEIQALKAGILEIADIFVINKADLPGAKTLHADLVATLAMRACGAADWHPPVLLASAQENDLGGLSETIDAHTAWRAGVLDVREGARARMRYHVASLLGRRIDEVLSAYDADLLDGDIGTVYRTVLAQL